MTLYGTNQESERRPQGRSPATAGRSATKKKRALMMGNNPLFRECFALVLEWRTGVECVRAAASLSGARRVLGDVGTAPHVAVVDLGPHGTGTEILGRLGDARVLALTAGPAPEHRARLIQAGADEVIPTASPLEEIVGAVQRLIRE